MKFSVRLPFLIALLAPLSAWAEAAAIPAAFSSLRSEVESDRASMAIGAGKYLCAESWHTEVGYITHCIQLPIGRFTYSGAGSYHSSNGFDIGRQEGRLSVPVGTTILSGRLGYDFDKTRLMSNETRFSDLKSNLNGLFVDRYLRLDLTDEHTMSAGIDGLVPISKDRKIVAGVSGAYVRRTGFYYAEESLFRPDTAYRPINSALFYDYGNGAYDLDLYAGIGRWSQRQFSQRPYGILWNLSWALSRSYSIPRYHGDFRPYFTDYPVWPTVTSFGGITQNNHYAGINASAHYLPTDYDVLRAFNNRNVFFKPWMSVDYASVGLFADIRDFHETRINRWITDSDITCGTTTRQAYLVHPTLSTSAAVRAFLFGHLYLKVAFSAAMYSDMLQDRTSLHSYGTVQINSGMNFLIRDTYLVEVGQSLDLDIDSDEGPTLYRDVQRNRLEDQSWPREWSLFFRVRLER